MYENILDYLKGYIDYGFYWYTLAGLLLFFIYSALKNYLADKFRWSILYILFGGYIVTLIGVMLSPWKESGGLIYPTEWFSLSDWQTGSFFTLAFSDWKFEMLPSEAWDTVFAGKLISALLFVPFGFLVPLIWKDVKYKVLTIGLVAITATEALQLIVNRTFSLAELVMEFIGIAAGFVLFMFLFPLIKLWLYPTKKDGGKK